MLTLEKPITAAHCTFMLRCRIMRITQATSARIPSRCITSFRHLEFSSTLANARATMACPLAAVIVHDSDADEDVDAATDVPALFRDAAEVAVVAVPTVGSGRDAPSSPLPETEAAFADGEADAEEEEDEAEEGPAKETATGVAEEEEEEVEAAEEMAEETKGDEDGEDEEDKEEEIEAAEGDEKEAADAANEAEADG